MSRMFDAVPSRIVSEVRRLPVVAAAMPVRFDRILKRIPGDQSLHRRTPHLSLIHI